MAEDLLGKVCLSCGAHIENEYTGVLCQSCFDIEQTPPVPTWKQYFGGPVTPGFICAVLPFVLSFYVGAVSFTALFGGALAVPIGAFALARSPSELRGKRGVGAGIVVALGALQLYLSNFWLLF